MNILPLPTASAQSHTQRRVPSSTGRYVPLAASLLSAVALAGVGFVIARVVGSPSPEQTAAIAAQFLPQCRRDVAPEPAERAVYVGVTLLAPLVVLTLLALLSNLDRRLQESQRDPLARLIEQAVPVFLLVGIYHLFYTYAFGYLTGLGANNARGLWGVTTLAALMAAIIVAYLRPRKSRAPRWAKGWLVLGMASALAVLAYPFRVFGFDELVHFTADTQPAHSFAPVLHAAVLGYHGRAFSLIGAPQYGFYGYLLGPWFRLIGLNTWTFTATLFALHLVALFLFLHAVCATIRTLRGRLLLVASMAFLALGLVQPALDAWDPYLQYYPIRFIFPALSVVFLYWTYRVPKLWLITLCSFVLGVGTLWNLDSGVVTAIAWLVVQGALATGAWLGGRARYGRQVGHFVGSVIGIAVGAALTFLAIGNAAPPGLDQSLWLNKQQAFYISGFYMLPMPLTMHPWYLVAFVYLFGLCISCKRLLRDHATGFRPRLAFMLSILGFGLFSYYQGRSHDLCVPTTLWLAVVLLVIWLDGNLRLPSKTHPPMTRFLWTALLAGVPCILVGSLLANSPPLLRRWTEHVTYTLDTHASRPRLSALPSLRPAELGTPGVMVEGVLQSAIYAETGTAPPLDLPCDLELVLLSDRAVIDSALSAFSRESEPFDLLPGSRSKASKIKLVRLTHPGSGPSEPKP